MMAGMLSTVVSLLEPQTVSEELAEAASSRHQSGWTMATSLFTWQQSLIIVPLFVDDSIRQETSSGSLPSLFTAVRKRKSVRLA